jgi:hypothetical protein
MSRILGTLTSWEYKEENGKLVKYKVHMTVRGDQQVEGESFQPSPYSPVLKAYEAWLLLAIAAADCCLDWKTDTSHAFLLWKRFSPQPRGFASILHSQHRCLHGFVPLQARNNCQHFITAWSIWEGSAACSSYTVSAREPAEISTRDTLTLTAEAAAPSLVGLHLGT